MFGALPIEDEDQMFFFIFLRICLNFCPVSYLPSHHSLSELSMVPVTSSDSLSEELSPKEVEKWRWPDAVAKTGSVGWKLKNNKVDWMLKIYINIDMLDFNMIYLNFQLKLTTAEINVLQREWRTSTLICTGMQDLIAQPTGSKFKQSDTSKLQGRSFSNKKLFSLLWNRGHSSRNAAFLQTTF